MMTPTIFREGKMARINIEDRLFGDGRYLGMASYLGNDEVALGKMIKAFRLAQGFYEKGLNIPEVIFNASGLDCLILFGLAEKKEDGVYVKGSKKQFSWIEQKSNAGKKSGESRSKKTKKAKVVHEKPEINDEKGTEMNGRSVSFEQNANAGERKANVDEPLTPSPSLPPSLLDKKKADAESKKIKPDEVINLFNTLLAGKGRIERFIAYYMPSGMLNEFITTSSKPEFCKLEQWEEYFKLVATRKKLLDYPATLKFLVKHDNALEIFSGGYQDKPEPIKAQKTTNRDAQEMASAIYGKVTAGSLSDLMKRISTFDPVEIRALDIFGQASQFFHCKTEFDTNALKIKLKNACVEALSENRMAG
jgi:hypothetical protein